MVWVNVLLFSEVQSFELFSFYTIWNFLLQTVYFGLAAIQSSQILIWPNCLYQARLACVVSILFEICLPASMCVCVIMWGLLAPAAAANGNPQMMEICFGWLSYFQHLANTIALMVDFAMAGMPIRTHHLFFLLLWTGIYYTCCVAIHQSTGRWPYFFLRESSILPFWCVGISALHVLFYLATSQVSSWMQRRIRHSDLGAPVMQEYRHEQSSCTRREVGHDLS
eukprot:TRINITY_DN71738_c0_g1_i1.p1 TRINITY_DN71738_c0_g1~~TRINITY_DN71738_c0_g1_i1.p1  ORF type:complete len:224 (+),score=5.46 TRINITY_DN71738_c0_g1_i1:237-908(+)